MGTCRSRGRRRRWQGPSSPPRSGGTWRSCTGGCRPARWRRSSRRGVVPDVFDGSSWVGLIAFELGDARVGPFPPSPVGGRFTEVNVRLYGVDGEGTPRGGLPVAGGVESAGGPRGPGALLPSLHVGADRAAAHRKRLGVRIAAHRRPAIRCGAGVRAACLRRHRADRRRPLAAVPDLAMGTVPPPARSNPVAAQRARAMGPSSRAGGPPSRRSLRRRRFALVADRPPDSVLYSEGVTSRFGRGQWLENRASARGSALIQGALRSAGRLVSTLTGDEADGPARAAFGEGCVRAFAEVFAVTES